MQRGSTCTGPSFLKKWSRTFLVLPDNFLELIVTFITKAPFLAYNLMDKQTMLQSKLFYMAFLWKYCFAHPQKYSYHYAWHPRQSLRGILFRFKLTIKGAYPQSLLHVITEWTPMASPAILVKTILTPLASGVCGNTLVQSNNLCPCPLHNLIP